MKTTNAEAKSKIQRVIRSIAKRHSPAEVFHDFVRMSAIAYHNAPKIDQELEDEYKRTIQKYGPEEQKKFSEALLYLIIAMGGKPRDILGEVYMEMNLANEEGGQFFSPFEVAELVAEITYPIPKDGDRIEVAEPSCGSGGMLIAIATRLKSKGVNFQEKLYVTAEDVDMKAVYMTYLQLSIMGIKGTVINRDTLSGETWATLITPALQMEV